MRRSRRTLAAATAAAALVVAALAPPTGAVAQVPDAGATATTSVPLPTISEWLTNGNQSALLAPQPPIAFGAQKASGAEVVTVANATTFQTMTGFGAALTDSSAWLLSQLPPATLTATLAQLFGPGRLSVLRIALGASDFVNGAPYSYDDLPAGNTDAPLASFSIARDETYLVPLLRAILAVNPSLRIVATAWSAPGWMKTSGSLIGGSLVPSWEVAYGRYLVRAVQAFAADGVAINALSVTDEPTFSPGDYPGMAMTEAQEARLIGQNLGPDLRSAGVSVAVLGYDDNWSNTAYPKSLLANTTAGPALAGVAFHCYAGTPAAQSTVHQAYPQAAIWMDECSGGSWSAGFAADLVWETRNLVIGATRNWAQAVLWWNLALDPSGGPHNGGCTTCRGVVTVDPATGTVTPNVEYWALAQASIATEPGAVRVSSNTFGNGEVESVAFRNPDGRDTLIVVNSGTTPRELQIRSGSLSGPIWLQGGDVATFNW